MNKKNYFQNIAQQLNRKVAPAESEGPSFALLKIMEYWVRFLQADSDYLNIEPIVALMNFETQTELVYALAKIEEENLRLPAAVASRVNYCGPHSRQFLKKYPNADYHFEVKHCINNIKNLTRDVFSEAEWKKFKNTVIPLFLKFAWNELNKGGAENDATMARIEKLQNLSHLQDDEIEIILYLWLQEYGEMDVSSKKKGPSTGNRSRYMEKDFDLIPIATGLPKQSVADMLNSDSLLSKLGIINEDADLDRDIIFHLNGQNEISKISNTEMAEEPKIPFKTLAKDRPEADTLVYLLKNHDYKKPLNILFYGRAGTGKSELAKALAKEVGLPMYVTKDCDKGDRYGNDFTNLSETILRRRVRTIRFIAINNENAKTIILVDEADQMLNSFEKGALNMLMEDIYTPIIWISNSMEHVQESTCRRFDYSMEFQNFTAEKRAVQLQSVLESFHVPHLISEEEVKSIAAEYPVTVGGYTKAVQNAIPAAKQKKVNPIDIIRQTLDAHANLLNITLDNTRDKTTHAPAYTLSGLNIDQSINDILEIAANFNEIWDSLDGGSAAQSLNILLYGAPGTGKTEFVRYLARSLNRNLVIKRASDLLGKFVGETEANIKAAFCEAEESKAILFFDEADSFLNNRNNAERNFEVQQVNELLTQMENFNGIFIAATNFNGRLDNASRRRFAIKVKFDYLTREGIEMIWDSFFPKLSCPEHVKRMTALAPGDFGAVYNQLRYMPAQKLTADRIAKALEREIEVKEGIENKRRMGF